MIEFNGGYLHPSLQPSGPWRRRCPGPGAGRAPGGGRPWTGLPELREWFARGIGGPVTAAGVLVTSGGQSALTTALRALAPPGSPRPRRVAPPTGHAGHRPRGGTAPVPVPVDADGVRPALLADAFRATGARVLVCQPCSRTPPAPCSPPAGVARCCASPARRRAFVVEDDFVRRLVHEDAGPLPRPLAADDPDGVVVHVCSLTKATSPSFRVGALAAHGPVLERLRAIQIVDTFFVPRPLQEPRWNSSARPPGRATCARSRPRCAPAGTR
ncbi:hypothetical protein GCM10023238_33450 [Streptomyces heliomycini]